MRCMNIFENSIFVAHYQNSNKNDILVLNYNITKPIWSENSTKVVVLSIPVCFSLFNSKELSFAVIDKDEIFSS